MKCFHVPLQCALSTLGWESLTYNIVFDNPTNMKHEIFNCPLLNTCITDNMIIIIK